MKRRKKIVNHGRINYRELKKNQTLDELMANEEGKNKVESES